MWNKRTNANGKCVGNAQRIFQFSFVAVCSAKNHKKAMMQPAIPAVPKSTKSTKRNLFGKNSVPIKSKNANKLNSNNGLFHIGVLE
ncbi:MAG: hypothetical protein CSB01_03320 [Bacteroidia bacterium]|nr:MAG: hypothetical protein CSB01_03320 [Bacteroidia bacterium]